MSTCGVCGTEMTTYGAWRVDIGVRVHDNCVQTTLSALYVAEYRRLLDNFTSSGLRAEAKRLGVKVTSGGSYKDRALLRYEAAMRAADAAHAAARYGAATRVDNRHGIAVASRPAALDTEVAALRQQVASLREDLRRERALGLQMAGNFNAICKERDELKAQVDRLMGRSAEPAATMDEVQTARFRGLEVK